MKHFYALTFFLFLFTQGFSQTTKGSYIPNDLNLIEDYLKNINDEYVANIQGDNSGKIKKVFKNRDKKIVKAIEDSVFYFNPEVDRRLTSILKKIYVANPKVNPSNFKFFIKNDITPNAACYSDGMFTVNLGLFTTLEYDDELAFVLCHEIAHYILNHSLKNVREIVDLANSKESKEKIRSIKRQRYGQTRSALSLIDGMNIDYLNYSKEAEAEADALGYDLYANTGYNLQNSMTALSKLKLEDDIFFSYDVKLDSVFNFESYPFRGFWLEEESTLFDVEKEINDFNLVSDTLKSHPEITYRIQQIQPNIEKSATKSKLVSIDEHLKNIQKIAELQSIQYTIDLKLMDLAIYQLIKKFNSGKISADIYYTTMAELLQVIYKAKDAHQLGKFVPNSNSLQEEKYLNQIRLFLYNLELSEIRKMGLAFCESNKEKTATQKFRQIHQYFINLNN